MNALRPIGCPFGIDPRDWRAALVERIERQASILTNLIDALDLMEGDCDLEANGDAEPWLGWCASSAPANSEDLEIDETEPDKVRVVEADRGQAL